MKTKTGVVNKLKSNRAFWIICVLFLAIQYFLCIHYGMKRDYLFCDEVYSYGLANSNEYTFLHPGENDEPLDNWVSGSYFSDYMNYCDEAFNYKAAYVNQERDVHPPLYYMLLHTVCRFFKEAGYSAIPGIVLNLIILALVDIVLMYVAANLLESRWRGLAATVLWGISSVGISNCMLIRMYLLQTFEVLLFVAAHIYILKHKKKMTVPYFIMLAFTVFLGGLTHYYFYFFVAGLGLCVCIYLLSVKRVKEMFAYGFSLVAGLVCAIAVFPATITHIFGYRGDYATKNLTGFSIRKFISYIGYVNKAYFAGLLPVILLIIIALIIVYIVSKFVIIHISLKREEHSIKYSVDVNRIDVNGKYTGTLSANALLFAAVVIADAILAFVGIQGSELVNARYIYSALPVFAIFMVWGMAKLLAVVAPVNYNVIIGVVCLILCAGSIKVNGVDWQYVTYPERKEAVEQMAGKDCIIVCHGNGKWNNIYAGINAFSVMDRCRYVYEDDLGELSDLTADCGDELYMAVINDPRFDKTEIQKDIKKIRKTTKYKNVEKTYDYAGIKIFRMTTK